MDPIPVLAVNEIIRKSEAGFTEPYLCILSDNNQYYVKGRSAMIKGVIAETLCATLGRNFGLPIPEFSIAEVDREILKFSPEAKSKIGEGQWFASRLKTDLTEVKIPDLDSFDKNVLQKIFLFDAWIKNEDRTGTENGGNPNLFFSASTQDIVVIDHNLAFDRNFDFDKTRNLHICRDYWFSNPQDLLLRETYAPSMQVALDGLHEYESELPHEWLIEEPEFLEFAMDTLRRFNTDEFWEPLTWER